MADRMGPNLKHVHLTDGTDRPRTSTSCPAAARPAPPTSCPPRARRVRGRHRGRDQHPPLHHPRRARDRPARVAGVRARALRRAGQVAVDPRRPTDQWGLTCDVLAPIRGQPESVDRSVRLSASHVRRSSDLGPMNPPRRYSRRHAGPRSPRVEGTSPGRPRHPRRGAEGGPGVVRREGLPGYDDPRRRSRGRRGSGAGAPLLRHEGRPVRRGPGDPHRPAGDRWPPSSRAVPTARPSGSSPRSWRCGTTRSCGRRC